MTKPADSGQIAKARRCWSEWCGANGIEAAEGWLELTPEQARQFAIAFHESELDSIQRKVACSFCGTITEYDHKKEHAQTDAILAHIETCEKSPVKQLLGALAEIDRLKSERQAVIEDCAKVLENGANQWDADAKTAARNGDSAGGMIGITVASALRKTAAAIRSME